MYNPFPPTPQIGFIVHDLTASQLGFYLTNNLNQYKNPNINIAVFAETITPHCLLPQFACFNISEAWGFSGILIATSLVSAQRLLTYTYCQDKYFYVWDLEWQRGSSRPNAFYRSVYNSIKLIARNDYHKAAIENCWNNKVVGCTENFNLEQMVKIITNGN